MNEALDELSLFDERDPDLLSIREWARTTETGSRTDLSFYPTEETWSKVCSEADACLGLRCSHREGCFVLKARREAASAKILIANHHLLFADLAFRMAGSGFDDPAVLPPFRRLIFDEAHNVEKAASSFFLPELFPFHDSPIYRPAVPPPEGQAHRALPCSCQAAGEKRALQAGAGVRLRRSLRARKSWMKREWR